MHGDGRFGRVDHPPMELRGSTARCRAERAERASAEEILSARRHGDPGAGHPHDASAREPGSDREVQARVDGGQAGSKPPRGSQTVRRTSIPGSTTPSTSSRVSCWDWSSSSSASGMVVPNEEMLSPSGQRTRSSGSTSFGPAMTTDGATSTAASRRARARARARRRRAAATASRRRASSDSGDAGRGLLGDGDRIAERERPAGIRVASWGRNRRTRAARSRAVRRGRRRRPPGSPGAGSVRRGASSVRSRWSAPLADDQDGGDTGLERELGSA